MLADRGDDRWQLHRKQHLAEETLLGGLEARAGRCLRPAIQSGVLETIDDAGEFQGFFHVPVDDGPGIGVSVVDLDLRGRQFVPQDLIFDTGEAQRSRHVEPSRLEIACDQFHGGDPALANAGDELLAIGERRLRSPEPEPHGIGKVVDLGRPRRRGVEDPRGGQMVLEPNAADALLRSLLGSECALASCDTAHLVRFVEGDDAVEIGAGPVDDLLQPAMFPAHRSKGRIGDQKDALVKPDGFVDLPVRYGLNVTGEPAEGRPITASIFEEGRVLGDPDIATPPLKPVVKNGGRDLATLACPGSVPEEETLSVAAALLRDNEADTILVR